MAEENNVSRVNFWREVRKEMRLQLASIRDIMLLIHNSAEFEDISEFLSFFPDGADVTYISLAKTYDSIKPTIKAMSGNNIFVVDCISLGLTDEEEGYDHTYASLPGSLSDMRILIEKTIADQHSNYIVVDSLSQLLDYSQLQKTPTDVYNFYDQLKQIYYRTGCKIILLYDENYVMTIKDLPIYYLDSIMRMEVKQQKRYWT